MKVFSRFLLVAAVIALIAGAWLLGPSTSPLEQDEGTRNFGTVYKLQKTVFEVRIKNRSNNPVRIVGVGWG